MEIDTKEASLKTFSVTINALHINKKQVTLAVFRQFPDVPIMINGERQPLNFWGIVNYSINGHGQKWIVSEHKNQLYRSCSDDYIISKLELNHKNTYEKWLAHTSYADGSTEERPYYVCASRSTAALEAKRLMETMRHISNAINVAHELEQLEQLFIAV